MLADMAYLTLRQPEFDEHAGQQGEGENETEYQT
jgi:hypothetical protein